MRIGHRERQRTEDGGQKMEITNNKSQITNKYQ